MSIESPASIPILIGPAVFRERDNFIMNRTIIILAILGVVSTCYALPQPPGGPARDDLDPKPDYYGYNYDGYDNDYDGYNNDYDGYDNDYDGYDNHYDGYDNNYDGYDNDYDYYGRGRADELDRKPYYYGQEGVLPNR